MNSKKYKTKDGKIIKIKTDPYSEDIHRFLINTVPRLTYDEILDGELERKADGFVVTALKEQNDDVKNLILSYAVFNAISKRP